jgi:D-alanyl-D-alanine carboxypeptidase (penicillin-binding protein 5/6)
MKLTDIERQLITILVILSTIGIFYATSINHELKLNQAKERDVVAYENSIKPFLNLSLNSKSFAILNTKTNHFLYKKNAEEPLPLASLAKIMSTVVVLENVPADHIFEISKESLSQIGDNGLLLGEKWNRDDLLKFTLIDSSNDAIHELAKETGEIIDPTSDNPVGVFIKAMNDKAKSFGYKNMVFYNESGLDVTPDTNGAYASARDISKLFSYAITTYPDIFSVTSQKQAVINSFDKEHTAENTNKVIQDIPGVIASKTGYTIISGGNLIVAVPDENGQTMIVVVLGSTFDDRFVDIKTLSAAVAQSTKKLFNLDN